MLTFKTVALIALDTTPRALTLVSMNVDNMLMEQQSVVFTFTYILKIEHFSDESLCAMHTLITYLDRTKSLRKSNFVFVSCVTYNRVSTSTIARWLKCVLQLAGIDSHTFKAHSYRSASTSAAFIKGCSLKHILSTADWSSDKTFRKFYLSCPLKSGRNVSFNEAVFSGN
jgi:site-specific recombinase XerD